MSPDSDVIGTNYDGTTAGKIWHPVRNRISPRNSLDRLLAGLWPVRAGRLSGRMAQAQTTERVIVNRYTGLAIEGYDPVAYFADARAEPRPAGFRGVRGRRGLALPQRRQPRLLRRPSRNLRPPVRRLRSDRSGPRRHLCRQPPVLADCPDSGFICSAARKTATPSPPIPQRFLREAKARWPALEQDWRVGLSFRAMAKP